MVPSFWIAEYLRKAERASKRQLPYGILLDSAHPPTKTTTIITTNTNNSSISSYTNSSYTNSSYTNSSYINSSYTNSSYTNSSYTNSSYTNSSTDDDNDNNTTSNSRSDSSNISGLPQYLRHSHPPVPRETSIHGAPTKGLNQSAGAYQTTKEEEVAYNKEMTRVWAREAHLASVREHAWKEKEKEKEHEWKEEEAMYQRVKRQRERRERKGNGQIADAAKGP
ncbi:hypothetical protein B0T20DRAFT_476575 [Sordaria brevicollis]|uniref:Uncharacterized protein n=1 Tax=Sordaria brevicollis TaxID=83679 RepID=A0AAE0PJ39_SORBR|nr:hypothetical protein B0T20DRAFT_476575 [Sordaria brevicollis]